MLMLWPLWDKDEVNQFFLSHVNISLFLIIFLFLASIRWWTLCQTENAKPQIFLHIKKKKKIELFVILYPISKSCLTICPANILLIDWSCLVIFFLSSNKSFQFIYYYYYFLKSSTIPPPFFSFFYMEKLYYSR